MFYVAEESNVCPAETEGVFLLLYSKEISNSIEGCQTSAVGPLKCVTWCINKPFDDRRPNKLQFTCSISK